MRLISLPVFFISFFLATSLAAVEVIEGTPDAVNARADRAHDQTVRSTQSAGRVNSEMYVKMQQLEEEVRELRGLLEQQSYLIEQLTQRRLADYVNLERRINQIAGNSPDVSSIGNQAVSDPASVSIASPPLSSGSNSAAIPDPAPANIASTPATASAANEAREVYQAAYAQIKARKFDEAKRAFAVFIDSYPDSYYVPNAHFWLGELYYQSSDLSRARDAYYILVTQHANYRKVPRAKFKLGKIYHELGENEQAKVMLQSVINDHADSKDVQRARDYLNNSLR